MSLIQRMRTQKLLSFTVLLFTLSTGIVIGTLVNSGVKAGGDSSAAPEATALVIPSPVELSNTFTQIAKQVEPSVVNISTTYNPRPARASQGQGRRARPVPQDGDEEGMNDFFNRFFGNPFGNGAPNMPQQRSQATGSGVVVDRAGYILTNNHVVEKADRIQVKFTGDPTQYEAKIIGVDEATDMAVIRVEGKKNLTVAKIGNSDAVNVGDWAVAIGSPFGFQATVTAGIISAKEREIPETVNRQFQHFLQTDAAINPGNSGGPLLNIRGEVIGINTAIASRSGGFQGVGFALPINTAAQVYNDIIKNGKVTRGSIGIRFTQSNTERSTALLKSFGADSGVFIEEVVAGGPSEKAGLRESDIIVSINGKPVKEGNDLVNTVVATPIGTALKITALRDRKPQEFTVVVGDLAHIFPDQFGGGRESAEVKPGVGVTSFGMSIENLTDQRRSTLNLRDKNGVLVVSVDPGGFADDIGLAKGDVLVSINQQPVNSTTDVTRIRETLKPGTAVAFRVLRQADRQGNWTSTFLAGTLPIN